MEQTDSCHREAGRGDCMKEGAGISQRAYTHAPQTQTAVWGWPEGRWGQGLGGGGQREEMETSVIVSTKKIIKLK